MLHSVFGLCFLVYLAISGAISVAGLALIAKLYYFPKPPHANTLVKLVDLGLDGSGLRSEASSPLLQNYRR